MEGTPPKPPAARRTPPLPDDDKPQLMEVEVELPTAHSVNLSSSPSSRTITSCGNLDEGFHGHVNFIAKGDCKNSEELFFAEVVTMAPEFIIQEVFQVFPLTNNTAISVEMSLSIQKMEHCMRVAMLLRVIIMSSMHYLLCLLFSS
uniref:DUF3615 domain-containing protein n=1 Tax=Oryza nivara TaxID=4536 RepID=A0A0E0IW71_ORYNI